MIVAALEYLAGQAVSPAGLKKALEWLQEHAADALLPERVEIDGKAVYALVQAYETIPAGAEVKLEAHKRYIDIQYIVSGEEMMGWADVRALRQPTAYNPDKDVFHGLLAASEMTPVQVRAGQAAVFYPEDAHAPKLAVSTPTAVRKIVVKVQVD
jgi:YhcH/YjgK/YiaL family protein